MLRIVVGEMLTESFDESTSTIVNVKSGGIATVELEHSLASLSKWESKWEKPFLGKEDKTPEETLDYVRCMVIDPNFTEELLMQFSAENFQAVNAYINSKQTATTVGVKPDTPGKAEVITAEIIYYWMVALNVPFECQHWHLERLFSLIQVCNIKNAPEKSNKVTKVDDLSRRRAMNEARKRQMQSRG